MFPRKIIQMGCAFLMWMGAPGIHAESSLSLQQSEQLALERDPVLKSHEQRVQALQHEAQAVDAWPDPRLRFGFANLPTDSFELDQEPMTQILLGYQQALPRGDSNHLNAELKNVQADQQRADRALRRRQVLLGVRKAWFQAYLQDATYHIIEKNRLLFRQQLDASESLYAAGKSQQQDVLQAELELSLLDDQLQQVASMQEESRALLARWIGDIPAEQKLNTDSMPGKSGLQGDIDELLTRLDQHPELKKQMEAVKVSEKQVALAQQKYSPQWSFDVSYGRRDGNNADGSGRADFFSALVNFDVPLFTEHNQDQMLAASKSRLLAARYEQTDLQWSLAAQLKTLYARFGKLQQRLQLYQTRVLPQARQNARAALNGYQSGVVSYSALTRARSAELKAELQSLKLTVEQAVVLAEIRFLIGESAS